MKNKFWLKLIGIVLLLHFVLISLSIIEVVIYSYLISPGKGPEFYDQHATISAPWISVIFGPLFCFLLVRWYVRRYSSKQLAFTIGLPVIYSVVDLAIVLLLGNGVEIFTPPMVIGIGLKLISSLISYLIFKPKENRGETVRLR